MRTKGAPLRTAAGSRLTGRKAAEALPFALARGVAHRRSEPCADTATVVNPAGRRHVRQLFSVTPRHEACRTGLLSHAELGAAGDLDVRGRKLMLVDAAIALTGLRADTEVRVVAAFGV